MRISTSSLDSFQYYLDGNVELDKYINDLMFRLDSRPMAVGRGFETLITSDVTAFEVNNIIYDEALILKGKQIINNYPVRKYQSKVTKDIILTTGIHTLVGMADIICGDIVIDIKTTANFKYDRYINSWQWKAYLYLFETDVFEYTVFEIQDKNNLVSLVDCHIFQCYSYSEMQKDLINILESFTDFIEKNNLQQYFENKKESE